MYYCTTNPISIHIKSLYFTVLPLCNPRINQKVYQFLEENPLMDDDRAETSEITMLLMIFQKLVCFHPQAEKLGGIYICRCTGES